MSSDAPAVRSETTPTPWEFVLEDDGNSSSVTAVIRMGSHLDGANGWEPQHRIEYEFPAQEESPEQYAEGVANAELICAAVNERAELIAAVRAGYDWIAAHGDRLPASAIPLAVQLQAAIDKADGVARITGASS